MFSTLCDIVNSIVNFFNSFSTKMGLDMLFIIALAVEAVLVVFFLVKSAFSYESSLNRALDKLNFWLFDKKTVTEDNIKDLNMLFKTKAPKRVCYYWQQYILFREGAPSSYMSTENLVEKPLKTSSYNLNIKNLSLFSGVWALVTSMFILIVTAFESVLTGKAVIMALLIPIFIFIICTVFAVYLRARKNTVLNSLYQNVALFGRFMDNACIDLPAYIDYQILFTPQEIEKGQPVLREFLDYKARKEKEEFNKAKEGLIKFETYDFTSTGVDGSIVLDRAMKESELFLKKKEKILVKVSQIEAELDSRRKNFDNIQKDYQTKIQASKENVNRLRQMQEETTNRIESNYYRKQQTQEIAKQEQFEQEFEQLRAKYLLEKGEGEEEIQKLNSELETYKNDVKNAMVGEYTTFFDKFCHSAEKVVAKVFTDKIESLKKENDQDKDRIMELEIKLKNIPQGAYDAATGQVEVAASQPIPTEGKFDQNGNYVFENGTFYDKDGNFHDENGNIYSQNGNLILKAEKKAVQPKEDELKIKEIVDFDTFDSFDFMTDTSQKDDIYSVAENIINDIDKDKEIKIINNIEKEDASKEPQLQEKANESVVDKIVPAKDIAEIVVEKDEIFDNVADSTQVRQQIHEETLDIEPKRRVGRPKKVTQIVEAKPIGKRGRPKKVGLVAETSFGGFEGHPGKEEQAARSTKRNVGRPKKIVKENIEIENIKRGRGRPKKENNSIFEINKKLNEEEAKLNSMRNDLNKELEQAMNGMTTKNEINKLTQRAKLMKEIDALQIEAKDAIAKNASESKIEEINMRLETLLNQIKQSN